MSRLVDLSVCPDCRAPLDPHGTCTVCGLRLQGPLATELVTVMRQADTLVERLRRASAPAPAPTPAPAPRRATAATVRVREETERLRDQDRPLPARTAPVAPMAPMAPVARPVAPASRRRLPAASVPVVLLSLGALCLLVAAVVFVAVTWGRLGITGRTLVLVGVTGLVALAAAVVTRRGLRGAAEALWAVVAGMLALDLAGARSAGLLGLDGLGATGLTTLAGSCLTVLGVGVGLWAVRQPVARVVVLEGVAVLGALLVVAARVWAGTDVAPTVTVATPLLAALGLVVRRRLVVAAVGFAVLSLVSWLLLLAEGLGRLGKDVPLVTWWAAGRGWPLLAAAVLAGAATRLPTSHAALPRVAAGAALLPLVVLAQLPAVPGDVTTALLRAAAATLLLALVVRLAPRAWAWGALPYTVVGAAVLGTWLAVGTWSTLGSVRLDGSTGPFRSLVPDPGVPAAWSHLVLAVAVAAALVALSRLVPEAHRGEADRAARALLPGTAALGVVDLVVVLGPPLVLAAAVATVGALVGLVVAWRSRTEALPGAVAASAAAYLSALALAVGSAASSLLVAVALVLAAAVATAFVAAQRERTTWLAATLGPVAVLLGALALAGVVGLLDLRPGEGTPLLAAYAGAVLLLAAPVSRALPARLALEATAGVLALAAAAQTASTGQLVVVVGVAAAAVTLLAVLHGDRGAVGWLAAALGTVAATTATGLAWAQPAAWLLPLVVALLVRGLLRRRARPDAPLPPSTLGSGLALSLVAAVVTVDAARDGLLSLAVVALLAAAVLTTLVLVDRRWRRSQPGDAEAAGAGFVGVLVVAMLLVALRPVAGVGDDVLAISLAVLAGAVALGASRAVRDGAARLALEAGAVVVALLSLVVASGDAATSWTLGLVGLAAATLAATHRDRTEVGWVAAGAALAAGAVRLDAGLPVAAGWALLTTLPLVLGGLRQLDRDGRATPASALRGTLASGIGLALAGLAVLAADPLPGWVSVAGAVLALAGAAVLLALLERREAPLESALAAALLAGAGAAAGRALTRVVELPGALDGTFLAVWLAVWAAVVAVGASRATRRATTRWTLEGAAVLLGLVCLGLAPDPVVLATLLTVLGSAASVVAVTNLDRAALGWPAAAVLGVATVLRVVEGVSAPELHTLPAALVLVAAGLWRVRTDPGASSLDMMGSGVTLALLPSLLLALGDPVSVRGALVGTASVLTLALGVRLRLVAPFALGALATALLAVRHLTPYADAVPRWVALAAVGTALLVVGVTWEARRRDLRTAGRYLAELR